MAHKLRIWGMILSANRLWAFNSQAPLPSHSHAGSVADLVSSNRRNRKKQGSASPEIKEEDEEPPHPLPSIRSYKEKIQQSNEPWFGLWSFAMDVAEIFVENFEEARGENGLRNAREGRSDHLC